MKPRSMVLAGLGLAAVLAATTATPVKAQTYPSVNIRFGHSVSATSASSLADAWVAQEVAKRSNGKVKFNMFWAGAAGSPAELFDLVSSGALDAAAVTPSWYSAKLPFFSPLSSMPFAYPDIASAQKVANTLYAEMPALQKEAKSNKLHVLRFALINTYHAMCKQPLRTVEDFKGRKVRSQGDLLPLVLNALGATPVTVLPGEFYEAMQRGTIDCIVLPWDFIASNRLYEVAKHASTINFGPIVAHASMMNLDKWNSLPPEVQKLITDVSKEAEAYDLQVVRESEAKSFAAIKAGGVEVVDFPDQAKLEKMIPDLFVVWAERMTKAGHGEQAQAIVKRWKELR